MARTRKTLPTKIDIAHLISAGVLASVCPRPLIEEVLKQTGKASQRTRLLPAPAVVYYVMALALWREAPLEEVLRVVCEGLHWLDPTQPSVQASKSAISQARTRLGPEVMRLLAQRVLTPIAKPTTPGAWFHGLRIMAVDGSVFDVADEKANAEFFGYHTAARGETAFPQLRLLGLVECGTHAVAAAAVAPYHTHERTLAASLLPQALKPGMLVLADRGFYGVELWQNACATEAKLLWRVRSDLKLPVLERYEDGSYRSEGSIRASKTRKIPLRVVEYTLKGQEASQETYRLITNIFDQDIKAEELAELYHQRWEIESVFDEIKTHLHGASTVLRSKTPDLVEQELWGLLLSHYAIRQLMLAAAGTQELDPDRLSFTHATRVIKRRMPQAAAFSPWEAEDLEEPAS